MSLRRRFAAATAGLCVAALTFTACGGGDHGATVQGIQLIRKGRLVTCTHLPYAPFQFVKDGKVVGFDVDMIDLVAKRLGLTQQVIDTPFETIKTGAALNAGKCDVAAAGMTIKPERARFIDFSKPYFDATQGLMAKKGVALTSLNEVKAERLRVGTQAQTTGEDYIRSKGIDSVSFKDSASLLNGLRSGQVDVIVEDYPVVRTWLKDPANARFGVAASLVTGEQYGFAVRKGYNPKLLGLINQTIDDARQNGEYRRIYERWIGPMPAGS